MREKQYKLKCYEGIHSRILVDEDFVKRNSFTLQRTENKIYERIKEGDMFDFGFDVLVDYLDWEKAKEFYNDDFVEEVESGKEEKPQKITDIFETCQDMLDYLIFGYSKALDERSLSASRTINKLGHWLWLLGRDDLRRLIDDDELYNPYGMPALIALTEKLRLEVPSDCLNFAKIKCD